MHIIVTGREEYKATHGHYPAGFGHWAFRFQNRMTGRWNGKALWCSHSRDDGSYHFGNDSSDTTLLPYTLAVQAAKAYAVLNGYDTVEVQA